MMRLSRWVPGALRVALCAALCAAVLPAAAEAQTRARLQGQLHGLKITLDKRDVLIVVVTLQNVGGRLGVCGLSWPEPARTSVPEFKSALLGDIVVEMRGRPLPVSLAGIPFYLSEAEAKAGTARCYTVNRPWSPDLAREPVTLRAREGRIRL